MKRSKVYLLQEISFYRNDCVIFSHAYEARYKVACSTGNSPAVPSSLTWILMLSLLCSIQGLGLQALK